MTSPTKEATAWRAQVEESISVVGWSADDARIAVADLGGQVTLLDGRDGVVLDPGPRHDGGAFALAWQPGGSVLATGGADGRVALLGTDRTVPTYVDVGGWVQALAWSRSGGHLAVGAGRSLVLLAADGALVARWDAQPSTVTDVVWSRDGNRVGAAAYGGLRWYAAARPAADPVRVFDWKGSLLLARVSPDGRWVASGNQDASVHVWRLWSGEDAEMTGYPEKVDILAFDRTSRWMANGGTNEVHLWDFSGPGPMGRAPRRLPGHDAQLSALAWQPTGDLLASAGRDGGVAVWAPGTPARRTPRLRLDARSRVTSLAWSPDGTRVAAATVDGALLAVTPS
ncbi:WD-40 repeat-containing protein [Blastococcus colisei]|uniref:WD-40 repeat-containing protein n=1 Tax=Blastococcus colisei TaxID=1564162 RepID=A0A543PHX2_9ACTN|nr:WD40 repeat domain-containing protein [Blastococcus colisei]TQN43686.1 WD-40 repeat-containing protein [Blastococcus colisei]